MDFEISESALEAVRKKGGTAAIDFVDARGRTGPVELSVDTHLEGKKTAGYRREHVEDVLILLAPKLVSHASKVQLVTKKRFVGGAKLVAVAEQNERRKSSS